MSTIFNWQGHFKLYAAIALMAALLGTLLAVGMIAGPAQAQDNTNANDGKYQEPQPCGQNVAHVPKNPVGEFSEGHVALFDAYWDYETQTINNNLCPPLAVHTVVEDEDGEVTGIVTARKKSNININETVFHAGNEFQYIITQADVDKYHFLPPAGTKVWWLKQDDPIAEAEETGPEEPELVLGISAGLFKKDDWHDPDGGEPLQYEFEAERDPEGRVAPFVVFENDAEDPVWDSRNADTTAIPINPGEYKHYNWMFFPGTDSHTYAFEVHVKGYVRTQPEEDVTPDEWQPLTWPTGPGAPAYDPVKGGAAFEKTLKEIEKVVSSEVGKETYTIQVGPLHLNEQPRFGAYLTVPAGSAAGTPVGDPIQLFGVDGDTLTFGLTGQHAGSFVVNEVLTEAGAAVQIEVAQNKNLTHDQPFYNMNLTISDGRDNENNLDDSIDQTLPIRVIVVPHEGQSTAALMIRNEHPRAGETVEIKTSLNVSGDNVAITEIVLVEQKLDTSGNVIRSQRHVTTNQPATFMVRQEQPGTRRYILEVLYAEGQGSDRRNTAVYSPSRELFWRN